MDISLFTKAVAAALSGYAAIGAPSRAENPPVSPQSNAVFAVSSINARDAGGGVLVATGVVTPFGVSGVRPPTMVVDGPTWNGLQMKARAAIAISDLNLNTSHEQPIGGAIEVAVLFNRGVRNLYAGPDMFIFDTGAGASGVAVSPIYRMPDETLREGEPVVLDMPVGSAGVSVGKTRMFGIGIDLDDWGVRGAAPEGGVLTGAVIRHEDGGAPFEPTKIMMADGAVIGMLGLRDGTTFAQDLGLQSGGAGFGSSGGSATGGGGGSVGPSPEIPAPGGAALMLGVMAVIGGRRARRAS